MRLQLVHVWIKLVQKHRWMLPTAAVGFHKINIVYRPSVIYLIVNKLLSLSLSLSLSLLYTYTHCSVCAPARASHLPPAPSDRHLPTPFPLLPSAPASPPTIRGYGSGIRQRWCVCEGGWGGGGRVIMPAAAIWCTYTRGRGPSSQAQPRHGTAHPLRERKTLWALD